MKLILLNGPPRCGKDTLAGFMFGYTNVKLSTILKEHTHRVYGLPPIASLFESKKDTPLHEFGGKTPRQCYIEEGKKLLDQHGLNYFVDELFMKLNPHGLYVVSDLGFKHEYRRFCRLVSNVILVRVHRHGHDFSNDSRSYVDGHTYDVSNNFGLACLKSDAMYLMEEMECRKK